MLGSKALKNHCMLVDAGASLLDNDEKEPIDALEQDGLKTVLEHFFLNFCRWAMHFYRFVVTF